MVYQTHGIIERKKYNQKTADRLFNLTLILKQDKIHEINISKSQFFINAHININGVFVNGAINELRARDCQYIIHSKLYFNNTNGC